MTRGTKRTATFGAAIPGIGHLLADVLPVDGPIIPPGRIGMSDLVVVREYTTHLRDVARRHGGQGTYAVDCHALGALALSTLDGARESIRSQARSQVARARDGWAPPDAHAKAQMDLTTGIAQLHFGEFDTAEPLLRARRRHSGRPTSGRSGCRHWRARSTRVPERRQRPGPSSPGARHQHPVDCCPSKGDEVAAAVQQTRGAHLVTRVPANMAHPQHNELFSALFAGAY